MTRSLSLFTAALTLCLNTTGAQEKPLDPQAPIPVQEARGKYDYLETDLANKRLLAAHPQNDTLEVSDLGSGKLVKSLQLGTVQGAVHDSVHNRYYITLSKPPKVIALDAATFADIAEIPLSGPADGILYSPKTGLVYAGHDDANEVWFIDTETNTIRSTAKLGGNGPEGSAIDSAGQRYFQNIKEANTVEVLDAATGKVLQSWPVTPATLPHGLVLDEPNHHLLIAGGNGKFVVMDSSTGKVLSSIDMAEHVDQIAFDPANGRVYCPSGKEGVISVIQMTGDTAKLLANVPVTKGAHTIALDPETHAVWIAYGDKSGSQIQKLAVPQK